MSEKEFVFEKIVYLSDTNLFGNVYFARYFDWQGMAREEFFRQIIKDNEKLLQQGIKFVTIEAITKYHRETSLFDNIIIKVRPDNVKITTFDLIFTYFNKNTNQLIAEGKQKIGFVDSMGKVIPIPDELKKGWVQFKKQ